MSIKMDAQYADKIEKGWAPPEFCVDSHRPSEKFPHSYSENQRVFDVSLQAGPIPYVMPLDLVVVANSFAQASKVAVDKANAMLDERQKQFDKGWAQDLPVNGEIPIVTRFAPAHITKMSVVREQATIFRHAKEVAEKPLTEQ